MLAVLLILGGIFIRPVPGHAQSAADFYKGKTIHFIVGYASGGGYDRYARLLASSMAKYIPGEPNIIINNLPGAATLKAIQYLQVKAETDGTAMALFDFFQIGNSVLSEEKDRIDYRQFKWIGSIAEDVSVCYIWHTLNVKNIKDAQNGHAYVFGLTAPGTMNEVRQKLIKNMLGVKIRTISGYPGSSAEKLAIERGELEGGCGGWSSVPADWLKDKKVTVLVRYVPDRPADMSPDIPYAGDLITDPQARKVLDFLTAPAQLGKPIIANKAVPEDRAKALQVAFDKAVKDPALLAGAKKSRLDMSPKSAAEAYKILDDLYSQPPELLAEARRVLKE
jgi:tripartite-type tricarboxylate transporter receptor subunit TctC